MTPHPDLDALSAHLDGPQPDVASHLVGCGPCRARLDDLRAAAQAVGRPVAVDDDRREQAIAAALAAFEGPAATAAPEGAAATAASEGPAAAVPPPVPLAERRRTQGRWLLAGSGAAAVVALVLGMVALVGGLGGNGNEGGPLALSDQSADTAAEAPPAMRESTGTVDAGDLGAVDNVTQLRQRVAARTGRSSVGGASGASGTGGVGSVATGPAASTGGAASSSSSGAAGSVATGPAASGTTAPAVNFGDPGPARSGVAGTRPCEERARAGRSFGVLASFATLTYEGTPAVVLGFPPLGQAGPLTLVVRSVPDCRLLAETVGP